MIDVRLREVPAREAGHEVLHELLLDYLTKGLILLAALLALVTASPTGVSPGWTSSRRPVRARYPCSTTDQGARF